MGEVPLYSPTCAAWRGRGSGCPQETPRGFCTSALSSLITDLTWQGFWLFTLIPQLPISFFFIVALPLRVNGTSTQLSFDRAGTDALQSGFWWVRSSPK